MRIGVSDRAWPRGVLRAIAPGMWSTAMYAPSTCLDGLVPAESDRVVCVFGHQLSTLAALHRALAIESPASQMLFCPRGWQTRVSAGKRETERCDP